MAQYAILIFDDPTAGDYTPEQQEASMRYADDLVASGAMVAAFALHGTESATSLRDDVVTDGPFLDAKEVVAGFYVVEAPDLDAALDLARANPAVAWRRGGLEVRPVAGGFVPQAR